MYSWAIFYKNFNYLMIHGHCTISCKTFTLYLCTISCKNYYLNSEFMSNFVQKKMIYAFGIDIQKIQNFVQKNTLSKNTNLYFIYA